MPRKSKYAIPDEKKELLLNLIETYNVKTTADLQEALKDLLGGTLPLRNWGSVYSELRIMYPGRMG